ncbi:MAG TPA: tetratricopeptide repeat protein [Bryobacteraceae bacterium]|nr:tetratricopeptide repeat protein [Bryobacteraceae bacterium]
MFNRNSRRLAILVVAGLGILGENALAQRGGTQGSPGGATPPSAGSPGTGSTGRTPTNPNNPNPLSIPQQNPNDNNGPFSNRPIFLSGKVMFDDGGPTNSDIRIERVCGATPRLEGHTDSKGRFSFQLGANTALDTDASNSGIGSDFGRPQNNSNSPFSRGNQGGLDGMFGCEIRAAYPGYRSDTVPLANRHSLDDPDLGTIILHRLANVQGSTISLTTAAAPKPARKAYEKGMQLAEKGKFEEAEKHFLEATDAYPKFAAAWYALGQVEQRQNKASEARKSYQAAIDADKKFVSPYDQLALLSAQSGSWEDAAKYSQTAIELNPVEFPSAFWYNAIANYNLKKTGEAEKSAKALLKMDTRHKYPQAESMLAQFAVNRGEYAEAATHLRAYLALVPNAKDADTLKAELQKIDDASAAKK